jgi:hypothetical protein
MKAHVKTFNNIRQGIMNNIDFGRQKTPWPSKGQQCFYTANSSHPANADRLTTSSIPKSKTTISAQVDENEIQTGVHMLQRASYNPSRNIIQ